MNKISLSSNVYERLQTFDRITAYLYGYKNGKSTQNRTAK